MKSFTQYEDEHVTIKLNLNSNGTSAGYSFLIIKAVERARCQSYYAANSEQGKKLSRAWAEDNPKRVKEIDRAWREANPKKAKAQNLAWAEANPEQGRRRSREWSAAHPEVSSAYRQSPEGKVAGARSYARRKHFGYEPVNQWFDGCNGHHMNETDIIYIPEGLHKSVSHSVLQDRNMKQINELAMNWLDDKRRNELL